MILRNLSNLALCLMILATSALLPTSVRAQDHPEAHGIVATLPVFDVVSIKRNTSMDANGHVQATADGIAVTNVPLDQIIRGAYGLTYQQQLQGFPSWIVTERFDMEAKVAAPEVQAFRALAPEQVHTMVQPILAERFKLAVHNESKLLPVYALVVAKTGSRLKPATPGDPYTNGMKGRDGIARPNSTAVRRERNEVHVIGQGISLARLVEVLSQQGADRMVVDKTGLAGKFDLTLSWTADDLSGATAAAGEPGGPSLFTAIEEQLGLKLEAIKAPVDCLVVDHVEMPSQN